MIRFVSISEHPTRDWMGFWIGERNGMITTAKARWSKGHKRDGEQLVGLVIPPPQSLIEVIRWEIMKRHRAINVVPDAIAACEALREEVYKAWHWPA